MNTQKQLVLLQCGDHEAQVCACRAFARARALANEFGQTVYLRNPITDEIVGTVRPTSKR
jgi:hypothetical protein